MFFESLAEWSNTRIRITNAERVLQNEDEISWRDVDTNEMKKFVGLTLLMGIVQKQNIHQCWSTDEIFSTPYFLHKDSLSRNRYLEIRAIEMDSLL